MDIYLFSLEIISDSVEQHILLILFISCIRKTLAMYANNLGGYERLLFLT